MENKKIAIIGATEFQVPLIRKCKELGYTTYVYAWKDDDAGEKEADFFVPISVIEKENIYQDIVAKGIGSCVSIASDITQLTANYVSRKLGNPCNKEIVDTLSTNKYEMRKAFLSAGLRTPKFIKCYEVPDEEKLNGFRYPLILKPTDRSGSRGIYKINNHAELTEVFEKSSTLSFEKACIIEEFIEGEEYSCEGISYKGEHHILAVTKKYTTGAPNFIETGHDEPANIQINEKEIFAALDALQIEYGASHSEFRIDKDGKLWIIEIGARMGGDCIGSDLVPLSTGYDFMRMVIDIASGKEPDLTIRNNNGSSHIRFIFNKNDLEEMKRANIIKSEIKDTDFTSDITDSTNRHGYYIY